MRSRIVAVTAGEAVHLYEDEVRRMKPAALAIATMLLLSMGPCRALEKDRYGMKITSKSNGSILYERCKRDAAACSVSAIDFMCGVNAIATVVPEAQGISRACMLHPGFADRLTAYLATHREEWNEAPQTLYFRALCTEWGP